MNITDAIGWVLGTIFQCAFLGGFVAIVGGWALVAGYKLMGRAGRGTHEGHEVPH
jgi:hypothetical protein